MKKEERAAAVTSVEQLPEHLRAPARVILRQYAKSMSAEGYPPEHIANDAALLLFKLAYFEPDECPSLDAYEASGSGGGWPWNSNLERREAIVSPRGYGRAYELWREGHRQAAAPA